MRVQFKHEEWGEEWQDWPYDVYNEEWAAEGIAEKYWREDPCDIDLFLFEVEVKSDRGIKKFVVDGSTRVEFWAREVRS